MGVAIADELREFEVCPSFHDSSSSSPPSKPCQIWGDVNVSVAAHRILKQGLDSSVSRHSQVRSKSLHLDMAQ